MNSKRRKLKYIREKNHYRLGGFGIDYFQMSNELNSDILFYQSHVIKMITQSLNKLNKKYKLTFGSHPSWVESGLSGNDFLRF